MSYQVCANKTRNKPWATTATTTATASATTTTGIVTECVTAVFRCKTLVKILGIIRGNCSLGRHLQMNIS